MARRGKPKRKVTQKRLAEFKTRPPRGKGNGIKGEGESDVVSEVEGVSADSPAQALVAVSALVGDNQDESEALSHIHPTGEVVDAEGTDMEVAPATSSLDVFSESESELTVDDSFSDPPLETVETPQVTGKSPDPSALWDLLQQLSKAVEERDAAIAERDAAVAERDAAVLARDAASSLLDMTRGKCLCDLAHERDIALKERDTARSLLHSTRDMSLLTALNERDTAIRERDIAIEARDASARLLTHGLFPSD
ncbi:hypothetical protein KIPB_013518, partial [Kipferlia bialata]|eukprot:g13518.t1